MHLPPGISLPPETASRKLAFALQKSTAELNAYPLKVNRETWSKNLSAATIAYGDARSECAEIVGKLDFNPGSGKHCAAAFRARGHTIGKTKTGRLSIPKERLQGIALSGDELGTKVMVARNLRSRLSQLEKWQIYADAGQVQPNWKQEGQPHGRYSSEEPCIHNRVVEIRETIEAREGKVFLSLDLGQAEYVTWASLSEDPLLTSLFTNGQDLHQRMWEEILEEVPDLSIKGGDPRQYGKEINFAQLYMMTVGTLAGKLGVDHDTAARINAAWKARAPKAVEYRSMVLDRAWQNSYVRTKFGRTRRVPDPRRLRHAARFQVEKTTWHHHNAGTAAEIVKAKQVKVWKVLRKRWTPDQARIVMNMYDELILEVDICLFPEVSGVTQEAFSAPMKGFLDFAVDVRGGSNWREISKDYAQELVG